MGKMANLHMVGAAMAAALTGCTGGGGGGGGGSVPPDTNQSSSVPENSNPPYQIAPTDDLALFMVHVHQDIYGDPTHFGFWWSVKSTFGTNLSNVRWTLRRLDGSGRTRSGTIDIPALDDGGDGHDRVTEWTDNDPGRHYYSLTIDANDRLDEASRTNNTYVFVVDVPASTDQSDPNDLEFYAREAHTHFMMPNFGYDVHFEVRNTGIVEVPATRWRLQIPSAGIDRLFDLDPIPAGAVTETSAEFQIVEPGTHAVTVTIDADDVVAENNEANNTRPFTILVGEPRGSG